MSGAPPVEWDGMPLVLEDLRPYAVVRGMVVSRLVV
jgi:hypothetical protein